MCPHLGYNAADLKWVEGKPGSATAYAESADGLTWVKPSLALVSWNGSTANNLVLDTGPVDPNRGVYRDDFESNATRRYKLFGSFARSGHGNQLPGSGLGTMTSPDGVHWDDYAPADSMRAAADTANNLLFDPDLKQFLAFSRNHCASMRCNESGWGNRRETRSTTSDLVSGKWTLAEEVLHGEHGYEMYSLVPWRSPKWKPGLYLGMGSFYATEDPEGHVYCELCRSTDYGVTWTRVAPHQSFIPLGKAGAFDSHTCYAANPLIDPRNESNTLFYYAGGNGPHSGGGAEHGRANFIGLAQGPTDGLITLPPGRHSVVSSAVIPAPHQSVGVAIVLGPRSRCAGGSGEIDDVDVVIRLVRPETGDALAVASMVAPCSAEGVSRHVAVWDRAFAKSAELRVVAIHIESQGMPLASVELF